jgi:heat shock protein beta
MFETAMLESGFSFDKPQEYTSRVFDLLKSNMGIEKDAELVDETQFHLPEEEDEEDKKEETKEETKEAPKDEL